MTRKRTPRATRKKAPALARMMLDIPPATATVLSKRVPMLAAGAIDPKKRKRREEQRMVAEKVAAGIEAGTAASRAMIAGGVAVAGAWWQAIGALAPAGFGGRKPARGRRSAAGAMQKVAQATLDAAVATGEAALRPAHRKVTANAKRLARAKRGP